MLICHRFSSTYVPSFRAFLLRDGRDCISAPLLYPASGKVRGLRTTLAGISHHWSSDISWPLPIYA